MNGFFVDLAAHARTTPGANLSVWWSERRCRTVGGELVRPDGHGVWTENGHSIAFWLEMDLGTGKRHQVTTKLDGYAALHRVTGSASRCCSGCPPPAVKHRYGTP